MVERLNRHRTPPPDYHKECKARIASMEGVLVELRESIARAGLADEEKARLTRLVDAVTVEKAHSRR